MSAPNPTKRKRRGAALLLVLFVVLMVSSLALNVVDTETQQSAVAHHVSDYERALYLANAGVHHACAMLLQDAAWRGTVTEGAYPGSDTYSVTAVDGVGAQIDVSSVGVAGEATRTLQVTLGY